MHALTSALCTPRPPSPVPSGHDQACTRPSRPVCRPRRRRPRTVPWRASCANVSDLWIGQSLAIALSVAQAPGEWPWSYWMMIAIHVALLFTASGRFAAVDRARAEHDEGRAVAAVVPLLLGWGAVVR